MLALQCEPEKRSGPARMHRRSNAGGFGRRLPGRTLSARLPLLDDFRPGGGVVLSWWMREGVGSADEATLEVIDATGRVVRAIEPASKGEGRDRWSGPALPVGTGLQRVRWDLRTDPAVRCSGMILWGLRTMAPAVPPGIYTVRLTVGDGHEMTAVATT